MFDLGVKLFDSGVKSFGLDVNPASGQVDRIFFIVYTDEEKVDCRKETPIMELVCA